ncbi:MAG: aldo/keto reductase [Candidatus Bathyarchaeota archaeon]|jgi:predicted aldo/keto reductase-like oxidoreductase
MKDVVLGKTGLKIKALGFGGIPIQRVSEEEAIAVVRRCYELGIDYYDTARNYTVSEERIGKALKDVRDDVVLATKSSCRTGEELLTELDISLKNLRTDWIDVYQLHNVSSREAWEKIKGPGGALEAAYNALDEGKIGHLGITSHDPMFLAEVIEEGNFETAMIPFNYLTPIPQERLLPLCSDINVGTVIMKPFGGGAFSNIDTALRFVIGSPNVDVVIPGMMTVKEVEENYATANGPLTLTESDYTLIEEDKEELGNEFCRACNYCQPCPQEIPISFLLRAETQFLKRMGWRPGTEERIAGVIEKAEGCSECGECEEKCPYELPIKRLVSEKRVSLAEVLAERAKQG